MRAPKIGLLSVTSPLHEPSRNVAIREVLAPPPLAGASCMQVAFNPLCTNLGRACSCYVFQIVQEQSHHIVLAAAVWVVSAPEPLQAQGRALDIVSIPKELVTRRGQAGARGQSRALQRKIERLCVEAERSILTALDCSTPQSGTWAKGWPMLSTRPFPGAQRSLVGVFIATTFGNQQLSNRIRADSCRHPVDRAVGGFADPSDT